MAAAGAARAERVDPRMISRIFIDRPIFAWVIAIVIMLAGLGSIFSLPIEQYPDIAPPSVNIRANYPGASAETVESSVTQVIEQHATYDLADGSVREASSTTTGTFEVEVSPPVGTGSDPVPGRLSVRVTSSTERLN